MGASPPVDYLAGMNPTVSDLLPQLVALLAGGLLASLGLGRWARTEGASASLARLGGRGIATLCVLATGLGFGIAYLIGRSLLAVALTDPGAMSPLGLFLLGVAIGVPLGLPGVVAAHHDTVRRSRADQERNARPATRAARLGYAAEIVVQIRELSPRPRTISAEVVGDGGRVLRFEGDIDATEGERLTAALRADLAAVGFERVEGRSGSAEWWSRV